MRKLGFICAVAGVLAFLLVLYDRAAASHPAFESEGLSGEEFRRLAESLPDDERRIVAVQFFRVHGVPFPGGAACLLIVPRTGWQILVYTRERGQDFHLDWQSDWLEGAFLVSSPRRLKIFIVEDEDIVQFEGCAPHSCGGDFAILIYVPSKQSTFSAQYINGRTEYSPGLDDPENQLYKEWLDSQIRELLIEAD